MSSETRSILSDRSINEGIEYLTRLAMLSQGSVVLTEGVEIQSISYPYSYTIQVQLFSCVTFTIRQITFATEVIDGTIETCDGFIFHHPSLDVLDYLATIDVYFVDVTLVTHLFCASINS